MTAVSKSTRERQRTLFSRPFEAPQHRCSKDFENIFHSAGRFTTAGPTVAQNLTLFASRGGELSKPRSIAALRGGEDMSTHRSQPDAAENLCEALRTVLSHRASSLCRQGRNQRGCDLPATKGVRGKARLEEILQCRGSALGMAPRDGVVASNSLECFPDSSLLPSPRVRPHIRAWFASIDVATSPGTAWPLGSDA